MPRNNPTGRSGQKKARGSAQASGRNFVQATEDFKSKGEKVNSGKLTGTYNAGGGISALPANTTVSMLPGTGLVLTKSIRTVRVNFRIDESLIAWCRLYAEDQGKTLTDLVVYGLLELQRKFGGAPPKVDQI